MRRYKFFAPQGDPKWEESHRLSSKAKAREVATSLAKLRGERVAVVHGGFSWIAIP